MSQIAHNTMEEREAKQARGEADTQLHGVWLVLARIAWIAVSAFAVTLSITNIPPGYAQYLVVCTQSSCPNQLATPEMVQALHNAGLTLQFYAIYLMALAIVATTIPCVIGFIIAWRKPRDGMALLVSLTLIIFGTVTFIDIQQLAAFYPIIQLPGDVLQILHDSLPLLAGYLFPSGRFVPRWTRWIALLVVLSATASAFFPMSPLDTNSWPDPWKTAIQFIPIVLLLIAQVYRYFRVSTPVQRQQTKWVVLGIIVTIIYFVALQIFGTLYPAFTQANSLGSLFAEATYFVAVLIVPLSIAFSILRYRLWDIDRLINRTLVYVSLTGILALLYFGCVILFQNGLRALTGQIGQSPITIVASTLLIVALFHPLRRRIQNLIDRRFYRRKYNAEKTLKAFNATLRSEVELNELREHLLNVVQETMQPSHVSLWLRKADEREKVPTNHF
jgi:DNA integrity scanning protein DisA with diadenylate cyclase activity